MIIPIPLSTYNLILQSLFVQLEHSTLVFLSLYVERTLLLHAKHSGVSYVCR